MYAVARRRHSKAKVRRSFIITTTVTSSREQHPRSHHKGATARVRTGDQQYPVLCNCQLGQDTDDTIQVSKVRIIRPEKKYAVAPEMSHLHLDASVCIYMQKICKICRHEIHKQNIPKICTHFPVLVWPGPDSNPARRPVSRSRPRAPATILPSPTTRSSPLGPGLSESRSEPRRRTGRRRDRHARIAES